MRGSKEYPHVNLYALVLLWAAFELQLYVGGLPVPMLAELKDTSGKTELGTSNFGFADHSFQASENAATSGHPQLAGTELRTPRTTGRCPSHDRQEPGLGLNPKGTIEPDDQEIIRFIERVKPEDTDWDKILENLENSKKKFLLVLDEASKKEGLSVGDIKKTIPTYAAKMEAEGNHKSLIQAAQSFRKVFCETISRAMKLFDGNPTTPSDEILEEISEKDEEVQYIYRKAQISKLQVSEAVETMRKLLEPRMKAKSMAIDKVKEKIEEDLKSEGNFAISDRELEIKALQEILKGSGEIDENLKSADEELKRSLEISQELRQKCLRQTLNYYQEEKGLEVVNTEAEAEVLKALVNYFQLWNAVRKSEMQLGASAEASNKLVEAQLDLKNKKEGRISFDYALKSLQDADFDTEKLKKHFQFAFDLNSSLDPKSFPLEIKDLWEKNQVIKTAEKRSFERQGQSDTEKKASIELEKAKENFLKAVRDANSAVESNSLIAFLRSIPNAAQKKLIEESPFFDSKALEKDRESLDHVYKEGFELMMNQANTDKSKYEKMLKDQIAAVKAGAEKMEYNLDQEALENAAKRVILLKTCYPCYPQLLKKVEKLGDLEKRLKEAWEHKILLAQSFRDEKVHTLRPMTAENHRLLKNAVASGVNPNDFEPLKAQISTDEAKVTFKTDEAYEEAVKVAQEKGLSGNFDERLEQELARLKADFKGDGTQFNEKNEYRNLKKKFATAIWLHYGEDQDNLEEMLRSVDQAEMSLGKTREKAIEMAKHPKPESVKAKKTGFLSRLWSRLRSSWSRFWSGLLKFLGIKRKNKIVPLTASETEPAKAVTDAPKTHGPKTLSPQKAEDQDKSEI